MIVAERFPGWESFAALATHIRFVRSHEQPHPARGRGHRFAAARTAAGAGAPLRAGRSAALPVRPARRGVRLAEADGLIGGRRPCQRPRRNSRSRSATLSLHPGRPAVVALVGTLGGFHLAQQRVHLVERQAAVGADRAVAGQRGRAVRCDVRSARANRRTRACRAAGRAPAPRRRPGPAAPAPRAARAASARPAARSRPSAASSSASSSAVAMSSGEALNTCGISRRCCGIARASSCRFSFS